MLTVIFMGNEIEVKTNPESRFAVQNQISLEEAIATINVNEVYDEANVVQSLRHLLKRAPTAPEIAACVWTYVPRVPEFSGSAAIVESAIEDLKAGASMDLDSFAELAEEITAQTEELTASIEASVEATQEYSDLQVGGIPPGVFASTMNKSQIMISKEGLLLIQADSATQVNTAGAFNGAGTGQKIFVELLNYDELPLADIDSLSFNAKNYRDGAASPGAMSWNLLTNFDNGFLSEANDYAVLVNDGLPVTFTQFYVLTSSFTNYSVTSSDRAFKCVGGTGIINFTGNTAIGVAEITGINSTNVNALTPGMYVRKTPAGLNALAEASMTFPDGTTIVSVDIGNNKVITSAAALVNGTTVSFKQYGGIAPIDRAGTANDTTTISGIANTADLQVNMKVSGTGVPANSYIVSIVANTSITLNASVTAGSPTLSFVATGKTGIPGNAENIGIPLTRIVANNPSAYITNNAPMTPIWAVADGGSPKNVTRMGGITLNQGGSSTTTHRVNILSSLSMNDTVFNFTK
jgi:hypothetical protein